MTFISYKQQFEELIAEILISEEKHAIWLNTLSFLENCGARKIAACEHPTLVREEMLKHAAEEFRHAHHLKKQIAKIANSKLDDYSLPNLLGGTASLHYLFRLDLKVCRLLKISNFDNLLMKRAAYLLTTYAIERRASELYQIYQNELKKINSAVTIKCLLIEEEEHLKEMEEGIKSLPYGKKLAEQACMHESLLCKNWLLSL
jgi:bacterioferritin (cytochrome b1)